MGDIDILYYQRSLAAERIDEYQSVCDEVDGKIERLEQAKKSISDYKDEVSSQRFALIGLRPREEWEGQHNQEYQESMNVMIEVFDTYHSKVDEVEDELNSEITRLENEKWDAYGILGDAINWFNDVGTAIQNFFN